MKNKFKFLIPFLAISFAIEILFISSHLVMAKGNFVKVTISGSQLTSEIDVTDPSLLNFFSFSYFPDARTEEPEVGAGYVITRYDGQIKDGTFHAWDKLHYYPNSTGTGGYVFYDGLLDGSSEFDGKWYTTSPEGDVALRRMLAASISSQQAWSQIQALIVSVLVLAIGTIVLLKIIRKRIVNKLQKL